MLGTSTRGGVSGVAHAYREQRVFERWGVACLPTDASGTMGRKIFITLGALPAYGRLSASAAHV